MYRHCLWFYQGIINQRSSYYYPSFLCRKVIRDLSDIGIPVHRLPKTFMYRISPKVRPPRNLLHVPPVLVATYRLVKLRLSWCHDMVQQGVPNSLLHQDIYSNPSRFFARTYKANLKLKSQVRNHSELSFPVKLMCL